MATCKPQIRLTANIGDLIVGFGCAKRNKSGQLVHYMKVTRETDFDAYWVDPEFSRKKPLFTGSRKQMFGDNIYHRNKNRWIQENSLHSLKDGRLNTKNLKRDTGTTNRVLISNEFAYWGGSGPKIPERFRNFSGEDVCPPRFHKCRFSDKLVKEFANWILRLEVSGYISEPTEWEILRRRERRRKN